MIETERLILGRPSVADFDESYAISSDVDLARYVGAKPATRGAAWNMLMRNIGHWSVFDFGIFTVRLKADGDYIGEVGLAYFSRGLGPSFDPFPEAAWVLAQRAHGRGYATEALIAVHKWMEVEHQTPRTVCMIQGDNLPSMRLAAKLGYTSFGETEHAGASSTMLERTWHQARTSAFQPKQTSAGAEPRIG